VEAKPGPVRFPLGVRLEIASIVVAAAVWLFPPTTRWLDGSYAGGFYATLQRALTGLTNPIPFAAGDVLLLAVIAGVLAIWVRAFRHRRSWSGIQRAALRTASLVACLYVWFTVAWGWNYVREPLYRTLGYDAASVDRVSLDRIEAAMVAELDAAAQPAHAAHDRGHDPRDSLRIAYEAALPLLDVHVPVKETRPKRTILDPYFVATGVSGMFFPYTFETYLASDVLWFEYPFDLGHEWGHLAGIARESDANFVGALTTLDSHDPILHYSGLLTVYGALPRIKKYDARLSSLVLGDYQAIRERNQRNIKRFAFKLAWNTYDKYLKAQHVQTGVVNYTEYVRLLLGTNVGREALTRATRRPLSPP
jgi:uncharacterized protein DUF3810